MFWSKPKKKVLVDVVKATAIVEMKCERYPERRITRVGDMVTYGLGTFVHSGKGMVEGYLSSERTLLKDDNGHYFPSCNIKNVIIVTEPHMIEVEE